MFRSKCRMPYFFILLFIRRRDSEPFAVTLANPHSGPLNRGHHFLIYHSGPLKPGHLRFDIIQDRAQVTGTSQGRRRRQEVRLAKADRSPRSGPVEPQSQKWYQYRNVRYENYTRCDAIPFEKLHFTRYEILQYDRMEIRYVIYDNASYDEELQRLQSTRDRPKPVELRGNLAISYFLTLGHSGVIDAPRYGIVIQSYHPSY